jgi:cytochrome c peroxidase/PKD repeat protein
VVVLALGALCTLGGVTGCGGGSDAGSQGDTAPASPAAALPAAEGRQQALGVRAAGAAVPAIAVAAPAAAEPRSQGQWGTLATWPLVSVHAVLMPDGKVLSYGSLADGRASGGVSVDVWDSSMALEAGHMSFANGTGTDFFCSSQLLLPPTAAASPAKVFIGGGDVWDGQKTTNVGNNNSSLFDVTQRRLERGANMQRPRWYATSTTLVNGETYIQGGSGGDTTPEVRQLDGKFRALTLVDTSALAFGYPRNFVMPDGRLFGTDSEGQMYFVGTEGKGELTWLSRLPLQYGGSDSSAAMFRPGRMLHFGGNSNGAVVVDVLSGVPQVMPTQSMSSQRRLVTATLLADGQVLATGGSMLWNQNVGVNTIAEIWNPVTGRWTQGAAGDRPGLYHSNALLLPDATVLTTTGGAPAPDGVNGADFRAQVYVPPYLFNANGKRAPRPSIVSTSDWLEIGKTFQVQTSSSTPISRVTLVKTGSNTHGLKMDQRFVELTFSSRAVAGGQQLQVQAPARAGDATPGYYMLFVFDAAGVPSPARILRLGVAPTPNWGQVPVIAQPAPRGPSVVGRADVLQMVASDPNGDPLRYAAAGLPPGMDIDPTTGRISGTPTAAGSYDVVVTVNDGLRHAGTSFVWTVGGAVPLVLSQEATAAAGVVNGAAVYAVVATGAGVEVSWNFGDGSLPTPWSTSQSMTKVFAKPGIYTVTVQVRDAAHGLVTRSFLQSVRLPATAKAPAASSTMAWQAGATGQPRLWVVNPDNDSISGFDTVTRTLWKEVPVGASPRSVAVARDGTLWVTNKHAATISVIDPINGSTLRTIALPRASQPHGLAMSPVAALAFVVLEATGQLLRLDTATGAVTGAVHVGPNVRHVSVAADGARAFVSRFITPPLAGEGAEKFPLPQARGGEVVPVATAAMKALPPVVLAYSDKPDAENQGSGIPNYLGPLVISPDGTQGHVPGKQDNVRRGALRNTGALNFQNTVRAISSRVVLANDGGATEDLSGRIDHDNASLASAAAYDATGVLLFVALETSREVAVLNAHTGVQLMRFDVGLAPQGLQLSADGRTLYVNNFMDRTVGVHDLSRLLTLNAAEVKTVATMKAVTVERLSPKVLEGKQYFYDARDERLARDRYMSCASCHADGGHDGRVWDLTQFGEGLRSTISLTGRGGTRTRMHWSANFDEVQDFEGQIRQLAGGKGLMPDSLYVPALRYPLGAPKAGKSAALDALAAYVNALNRFSPSPFRQADGALTPQASAGKAVFAERCASCHTGTNFSDGHKQLLHAVATTKPASGKRLGAGLLGLDTPNLRDAWATAPYLHDGSAATLADAVRAHLQPALTAAELAAVVAYTQQIGHEEASAPASTANLVVRAKASLAGRVGAQFEVRVDQRLVAAGQLDAQQWVDLPVDVPPLAPGSVVDVVFKNDASTATRDRNLIVESLRVNGAQTLSASAPGVVLDAGDGPAAFDGIDTVPASSTGGWIPWNGALRVVLPAGPPATGIVVRASASLAGGIGAEMQLRLNGVVLGTRMVSNTAPQDHAFQSPPVQVGDRIDIVFTNDAAVQAQDRNLFIESVQARGVLLRPDAPDVTYDRGKGEAAFDGRDVIAGSVRGGTMPWNGALRLRAR